MAAVFGPSKHRRAKHRTARKTTGERSCVVAPRSDRIPLDSARAARASPEAALGARRGCSARSRIMRRSYGLLLGLPVCFVPSFWSSMRSGEAEARGSRDGKRPDEDGIAIGWTTTKKDEPTFSTGWDLGLKRALSSQKWSSLQVSLFSRGALWQDSGTINLAVHQTLCFFLLAGCLGLFF